ncbi:MAG: hypothetical protein QOH29_2248, partial [Actinomycetota bacterium]|nr:hypothetical protein [Actinomycetota bacterium]
MQAFVSSIPAPTRAAAVDVRAVQAIDATFDLDAFMAGASSLFRDVRAAF